MIRLYSSVIALGVLQVCSCSADGGAAGAPGMLSMTGSGGSLANTSGTGGAGGATSATAAGGTSASASPDAGDLGLNDSGLPVGDASVTGTAPRNLALKHCYAAGCTAQWKEDPCNAFDGDNGTVTGPAKSWDSSQGTLAVDFGKSQTITKLAINYVNDKDPNPGYRIESSEDGHAWTTVKDVANPSFTDTQDDLHVTGRYVRVFCKQFFFDPWWMHSVSEIELWGIDGAL